jgi:hypothetical protein
MLNVLSCLNDFKFWAINTKMSRRATDFKWPQLNEGANECAEASALKTRKRSEGKING